MLQRKCGTPSYVAPEILDGDDGYGKPADMWSVGVVMFLVLRGKLPFQGDTDKEILVKDEWIFEKKIKDQNPNWTLIETKSF